MPPRKCYPATVMTTAATPQVRDASMVSEPVAAATSAHGDGLGAGQFCLGRSAPRSDQPSKWWSDQWDPGDSDDFGGESNPQSSADDDDGRDFFKKPQFYELGGRPSLLEGQCYSGNWRSDSQEKMKPWEANLRSEARRQGESIMRSVQLFRAARFCNGNGDLVQEVGAGPRSPADQRKKGAYVGGHHFQVTKEKAIGVLDEMREMIKRWRHKDAARRVAESAKMDQRPPVTPHPTQSSFRGMKTDQNTASKFNSSMIWDAVDDDGEKDEKDWASIEEDGEYDNGDISVEESDSEERAEDASGDIGVDSVGEVVFEGGVRRNVDEKNIRTPVQADEAVAYGASLAPILSCKGDVKVHDLLLENVISLSLGLDSVEGLVTVLTPGNTTMRKDLAKDDEKDVDEENKENVVTESMCKLMKRFWNVEGIQDAADVVVAASVVVLVVENVSDVVVVKSLSSIRRLQYLFPEPPPLYFNYSAFPDGMQRARHEELNSSLVTKKDMISTRRVEFFTGNSREGFMAVFDPGGNPCEQVYKARSTEVRYSVHMASPEIPPAWQAQTLDWFGWWEEYNSGVNEFQLIKKMREEDGNNSALESIDFVLNKDESTGERFSEIVGSPYYMTPEALKRNYGPEIDIWSTGVILYILLCGVPPSWAETEQGVAQAILRGHIDFKRESWPSVSENAKALVWQMLEPDIELKLTAQQVLEHPWLQNAKKAPNVHLGDVVKSRLKQFSVMNRFKRRARRVIADHLLVEEVEGIKEVFKMIDTDNDGIVSCEELKVGLTKFGTQLMESEMQMLIEAVDFQWKRKIRLWRVCCYFLFIYKGWLLVKSC